MGKILLTWTAVSRGEVEGCHANKIMLFLCEVRESGSCVYEEANIMGYYTISIDEHVITFRKIGMRSSLHNISECPFNTADRISDLRVKQSKRGSPLSLYLEVEGTAVLVNCQSTWSDIPEALNILLISAFLSKI
jgi:hypothetical protein